MGERERLEAAVGVRPGEPATHIGRAISEEDIRPSRLADGQQVAMLQDVGRMLSRRDEFVDVACPACGTHERTLRFRKYGLTYWACARCAMVYTSPRPSPATLDWFYRGSVNYAYWHRHIFPQSEQARRTRIVVPRVTRFLDICRRFGVTGGSCLEIGAGYGTFCQELHSRGVFSRIVGIEPTPDLAAHGRASGLEIIEQRFEEVSFAENARFDAVAFFEVIEHIFSPREFLERCRHALKPGGVLVLTCPNIEGFDVMALGPLSDTVDVEHLNYFNPRALKLLLDTCGFELVGVETPGELDAELVRKKALSGEYPLDEQPLLRKILIEDWDRLGGTFQAFLKEHGLSSHLWAGARLRG
ncbi:MAG: class I SAM-dependent methyltransferase [Acidobacteria bacterium]|nr:class I SAM-dependent methyltransferase [Acidobacteriota bacterium]MCA1649533.1 class I SAM-dependent methyltransferase [Acidobacteriota bacterium]